MIDDVTELEVRGQKIQNMFIIHQKHPPIHPSCVRWGTVSTMSPVHQVVVWFWMDSFYCGPDQNLCSGQNWQVLAEEHLGRCCPLLASPSSTLSLVQNQVRTLLLDPCGAEHQNQNRSVLLGKRPVQVGQ